MAVDITIPSVGESISQVLVGEWHVSEGDWVDVDQEIAGLETDKATFEIPAPQAGIITKILKQAGEAAEIGEAIAQLEPAPKPEGKSESAQTASGGAQTGAAARRGAEQGDGARTAAHVMPAAERMLAQSGTEPAAVKATGPGGRLLKEDVQRHLSGETHAGAEGARQERRIPMSPIRQTIARRLVDAQKSAALLTTFNECDMSMVKRLREAYQESFVAQHGVKLGFMSFFVKAVIDALNQFPAVGARVDGTDLVYTNYHDIGIAIGAGKGLIVPVLRNAERLSFAEIELAIADFAKRARENKIGLEELEGGTFTITNGGVYGSLLSTPIVNPPQSGVLGMHGIFDRPIALGGQVVVRPMMYIALTYDHRVVDGREAVTFLRRVKDVIEDPTRMLLEL